MDVNEASREGGIPLAAAVVAGNRPLVEMLLAAGADPDLRSGKGPSDEFMSARQLADRYSSLPEMRALAELMEAAVPRTRKRGDAR